MDIFEGRKSINRERSSTKGNETSHVLFRVYFHPLAADEQTISRARKAKWTPRIDISPSVCNCRKRTHYVSSMTLPPFARLHFPPFFSSSVYASLLLLSSSQVFALRVSLFVSFLLSYYFLSVSNSFDRDKWENARDFTRLSSLIIRNSWSLHRVNFRGGGGGGGNNDPLFARSIYTVAWDDNIRKVGLYIRV